MIASPLNGEATAANNDESIWNNNGTFKYTFYKADKTTTVSGDNLKDAAYVKFSWLYEAADYQDNQTYTQVVTFKNANGNILKEVTMKMTKVMPTDFPSSFSAKANQIVNGTYTCYLQPNTDSWLIGADPVSAGYMDLASAFNGLNDSNIKFTFAGSQKVGNDIKEVTVVDPYRLTIANDGNNFIKNGASHATTVTYVYKGISTYKDKDGNWKYRQNYPVDWSTKFNTVYACWHTASIWAWNGATAANKQITYGATGQTVPATKIKSTNSYNDAVFSKTLSEMLTGTTTKYLKLVKGKSKLISKSTGREDYFDVVENVENGTLTFVPKMDDIKSNPKANVDSELQIVCEDSFGCQFTIRLNFTVMKM